MISSSNNLGLITQTKIDKEQMKLLNNLLNTLFDNPDSLEFRVPVDHKGKIIKKR